MPKVNFCNCECEVVFEKYSVNNRPRIQLYDAETSEPVCTATVNMPEINLLPYEVIIKDSSENEGILEALQEANIIRDTGLFVRSNYVTYPICKVIL